MTNPESPGSLGEEDGGGSGGGAVVGAGRRGRETIGDGSAQRLWGLLMGGRSQAGDAANSAEQEPGAGAATRAPRGAEARGHGRLWRFSDESSCEIPLN